MPRYVAFLRGVSPMNCKMPELKACFESAGFEDVRTLLSSGNVVFSTRATSLPALERKAEQAMLGSMGHSFDTIIRSSAYLQALVARDPFAEFALPSTAKCIVTFLKREAEARTDLPIERDGARILMFTGTEVYSAYEPTPKGPVFMTLLERTFGKEITTRTLATVQKCAAA
jgi:uncharacterized protein (DUF1697 family)